MESIYLISLIVGGFFVALSVLGGGDTDHDIDMDGDFDLDLHLDADFDGDFDASFDASADSDLGLDHAGIAGADGASLGVVDILSIRTLFLFAAFFGLTGVLLNFFGSAEPATAFYSTLTGLTVGVGGNYIIKKFAYQSVSSHVTKQSLRGKTGQVILPFGNDDSGKILIEANGQRLQLVARSLDDDSIESFEQGDEVVIVRLEGRVAEVVKPT